MLTTLTWHRLQVDRTSTSTDSQQVSVNQPRGVACSCRSRICGTLYMRLHLKGGGGADMQRICLPDWTKTVSRAVSLAQNLLPCRERGSKCPTRPITAVWAGCQKGTVQKAYM